MPRIPSVAAFLDPANGFKPTETERRLIAACQEGEPCILSNERPTEPTEANTIRAELIRLLILGGTKDFGLHESGVWLEGGWITGGLDLRFAKGRGRLSLDACHFEERPDLEHARLDRLSFEGGNLPGLWAPYLDLKGSLYLHQSDVEGTCMLIGARIGGQIACVAAKFNGGGAKSLHGQGMTLGASIILHKVTAKGCIDLNLANIGGQLVCKDAMLDGETALNGQGMTIGTDLFLSGIRANGCINLHSAQIRGQMDCEMAILDGKGAPALNGQSMSVTGGLLFREVNIITGDLILTAAQVGDLVDDFASWNKIKGNLNLAGFTYDRLFGPLDIPGRLRWLKQGAWFDGTFSPQPYTQLAKTLAAMGHNRAARRVLYRRERVLGREERLLGYKRSDGVYLFPLENLKEDGKYLLRLSGDLLSRTVVGYGHKPWMALLWMIGLWFAATWLAHAAWINGDFAPNSDVMLVSDGWLAQLETPNPAEAWSSKGAAGQDWESFNRYARGLDLVVPILDIGQTDAWQPSRDRGPDGYRLWWARWLLQSMGWLVSALGVAAITGIMQKDRD